MRFPVLILACLLGLGAPAQADDGQVTVFAAASLRGALDDVAAGYGADVRLSYGGSGALARQVAAGAPADVVILASADWMDWLQRQGVVPDGARVDIAGNTLVVIAGRDAVPLAQPSDLPDRLHDGRLAMGQRDAVPAGVYAREWLQKSGLWDSLSPRLAETDDVRAALALVARGEAPFGIVYASDALAEPGVAVVFAVPATDHSPITYPAAALTDPGKAFVDNLRGTGAAAILARHGFSPARR